MRKDAHTYNIVRKKFFMFVMGFLILGALNYLSIALFKINFIQKITRKEKIMYRKIIPKSSTNTRVSTVVSLWMAPYLLSVWPSETLSPIHQMLRFFDLAKVTTLSNFELSPFALPNSAYDSFFYMRQ